MERNTIKILFMELTNFCNLQCAFCPDNIMTRPRGKMDFEFVKKLLDEISEHYPQATIVPSLMGEPLSYPHIFDFLELTKKKNLKVYLITNAILLKKDDVLNKVLQSELDTLALSYQTPDENSFQLRNAKNLSFEEYKEIIQKVIEKKIVLGSTLKIEIFVLDTSSCNVRGISVIDTPRQMVDVISSWQEFGEGLAKKHKIDFPLHIQKISEESILKMMSHSCGDEYLKFEILPEVNLAFKYAMSWGNSLLPDGVKVRPQEKGKCFPAALCILNNGNVTLCCEDYDGRLCIDNVKNKSIKDVWEGKRFQEIKEKMGNNELVFPFCKQCKSMLYYENTGRRFTWGKRKPAVITLKQQYLKAMKYYDNYGLKTSLKRLKEKFIDNL